MIDLLDKKDRWFLQRQGKFTASDIFKLLTPGSGGEMFGAGAKAYIRRKATEKLTHVWENPAMEGVKSLMHGKALEAEGFYEYVRRTQNHNMQYFGADSPLFLNYDDDSGGSPDALMGEGASVYWGAEIKCPFTGESHMEHIGMTHHYDLKEKSIQYYAQIQFLMLITGAPGWHFCSYDPRFKVHALQLKVLEILPDKKFQDNLQVRIRMAAKERDKIIASLEEAAGIR